MLVGDLVKWLVGLVRSLPWWKHVEPYVAVLCAGGIAIWSWHAYVSSAYRVDLPWPLVLQSYAAKVIGLFVVLLLAVVIVVRAGAALGRRARLIVVALLVAGTVLLVPYLNPRGVQNIRVKFVGRPAVDEYALAYLLYELNKRQRTWYLDVDFEPFDDGALTSAERQRCAGPGSALCWAQSLAGGEPLIALTSEPLGNASFWQNDANVSVISTDGWEQYKPPTEYEFLVYSIVVQSILIHLNMHCSGLPRDAFAERRNSAGGVFEFLPRRQAYRPIMLAGHMSRRDQALLLNCFGSEYLGNAERLLGLDWLRSGPVRENLAKSFGITL